MKEPWQRLCAYARRCVQAQATEMLVSHWMQDTLWWAHGEAEKLITGEVDAIPAPELLARLLAGGKLPGKRQALIYGWPTLVVTDLDRKRKVTPLFLVQTEPERGHSGQWHLHATGEPELNPAITASNLFAPCVAGDLEEALGQGVPFGDARALIEVGTRIAHLLGLSVRTPLNPDKLNEPIGNVPGCYNSALTVLTKTARSHAQLVEELKELEKRRDWAETAAAVLVAGADEAHGDGPPETGTLAAPLSCNESQALALERLRTERVTVVTGPPGTGKTDLVVNAVTNAWLDARTVLVTSTGNAAVDVAAERAGVPALIRPGNAQMSKTVADQVRTAMKWADRSTSDPAAARAQMKRAARARTKLIENLARLDGAERALRRIEEQREEAETSLEQVAGALWPATRPGPQGVDAEAVERRCKRLERAWFLRRFRLRRLCREIRCDENASLAQIGGWARAEQRCAELREAAQEHEAEHQRLKTAVGDPALSMRMADEEWNRASHEAMAAEVPAHIARNGGALSPFAWTKSGSEDFGRLVTKSLPILRGWACTALTAGRNFELKPALFDLVIIDEASQCTLASVLPMAYRARRLAVMGDPNRLPPIVTVGDKALRKIAETTGLDDDDLRRRGVHHKYGSAWFAFEKAAQPGSTILLDEHYRCHPQIAGWFNRMFYAGRLTMLSEIWNTSERGRTIAWMDVKGTPSRPPMASDWANEEEARQAVKCIGKILKTHEEGRTLGVITPFSAQARMVKNLATQEHGKTALEYRKFACGTAHQLQGGEWDAVVMCCVLAPGMPAHTARWVEKQRNLLNVAVSRARRTLLVLGHPEIGSLDSPTLASLRTYLRNDVANDKPEATEVGAHLRTDSHAEERLLNAMQIEGLRPLAKLDVQGYMLDFALVEDGIRLNIEVDGDHHVDACGRTRRQDVTRDRNLHKVGWSVLRIPAWRCYSKLDIVVDEIRTERARLIREAASRATQDSNVPHARQAPRGRREHRQRRRRTDHTA